MSFEQVLNDAIRKGLRDIGKSRSEEAFEPLTFDMGRPRMDLTKAARLAAELEDEELVGRHRRSGDFARFEGLRWTMPAD